MNFDTTFGLDAFDGHDYSNAEGNIKIFSRNRSLSKGPSKNENIGIDDLNIIELKKDASRDARLTKALKGARKNQNIGIDDLMIIETRKAPTTVHSNAEGQPEGAPLWIKGLIL